MDGIKRPLDGRGRTMIGPLEAGREKGLLLKYSHVQLISF
jgi:hypothetical protein